MSSDIRVLVIKLADRLHNMRTLAYMTKPKQIQKAKETLEIYAPLAHRLGINSLKWELEDLAFATLHPRRYREIQQMVNQRRPDREAFIEEAGRILSSELEAVGITGVEITGRAKHFYSIYEKMTRKGKEFNEIYDLTAMRVMVELGEGLLRGGGHHPLALEAAARALQGPDRHAQAQHVPEPPHHGARARGQAARDPDPHLRDAPTAEFGVAAHWLYKEGKGDQPAWVSRMMDWQSETRDPAEFLEALRSDLYSDEVYVFTPKGEVRDLPAGATPLDFAYDVHTDVGHRCVGAKINGRIVPLTYTLQSGDFVEILTSKAPRAPSRDWLNLVKTTKARSKISQFFRRERREDAEHQGREALQESLRKAGLPSQRVAGSPLLLEVIQEMGFRKADEFYISLGLGKTSVQVVVNKILHRLKAGQAVADEAAPPGVAPRGRRPHTATASSDLGIEVDGLADVLVRLAKCCKPVPGDPILGYISLGRGITIHREDCPNAKALQRNPERFTPVSWGGANQQSFRVEIAVDAWDRPRLLEDLSRAFSENGVNIISAHCAMEDQMVHDRFTVEVGDVDTLKAAVNGLRNVESVFDAYRVTPGS